ncbi:hypothetical protein RSAG8_04663, partial [Rhizoctonia solani AG-8 WAC10335]
MQIPRVNQGDITSAGPDPREVCGTARRAHMSSSACGAGAA